MVSRIRCCNKGPISGEESAGFGNWGTLATRAHVVLAKVPETTEGMLATWLCSHMSVCRPSLFPAVRWGVWDYLPISLG